MWFDSNCHTLRTQHKAFTKRGMCKLGLMDSLANIYKLLVWKRDSDRQNTEHPLPSSVGLAARWNMWQHCGPVSTGFWFRRGLPQLHILHPSSPVSLVWCEHAWQHWSYLIEQAHTLTTAHPVPCKGHGARVQEEGNILHKLSTVNAVPSSEEQEPSLFQNILPLVQSWWMSATAKLLHFLYPTNF